MMTYLTLEEMKAAISAPDQLSFQFLEVFECDQSLASSFYQSTSFARAFPPTGPRSALEIYLKSSWRLIGMIALQARPLGGARNDARKLQLEVLDQRINF